MSEATNCTNGCDKVCQQEDARRTFWHKKLFKFEEALYVEMQQLLEKQLSDQEKTHHLAQMEKWPQERFNEECRRMVEMSLTQQESLLRSQQTKLEAAQKQVASKMESEGISAIAQQQDSRKALLPAAITQDIETSSGINLCSFRRDLDVRPIRKVDYHCFSTAEGKFTCIQTLQSALFGKVRSYVFAASGQDDKRVAVKHIDKQKIVSKGLLITEPDERKAHFERMHCALEDPLTEMAVYQQLASHRNKCNNLVYNLYTYETPLEYLLVNEYVGGAQSNAHDLYGLIANEGRPTMNWIKNTMRQILGAVRHLHSLNIAHRDISLENMLMDANGVDVKLFDFGQAARIKSSTGDILRYWIPRGKCYYRSPEQSVPRSRMENVVCPGWYQRAGPVMQKAYGFYCEWLFPTDAVPGTAYTATPSGYRLVPADLFACGVSFFIMHAKQPPWGQVSMSHDEGRNFRWFASQPEKPGGDIAGLMNQLAIDKLPAEAVDLLGQLLHIMPSDRPSAQEALDFPWLSVSEGLERSVSGQRRSRPGDSDTCCTSSVGGLRQMVSSLSGRLMSSSSGQ